MAHHELNVEFENILLVGKKYPKYLEVTLEEILSFREHLKKIAANCDQEIASCKRSTWGSSASTLRSSALGLIFSAAEYCSPV